MGPVIIELASNGETPKSRNRHVPHTPQEIAADAIACFRAGAATLHNHMGKIRATGQAAADGYAPGWKPILEVFPDAILCPAPQQSEDLIEGLSHIGPCAKLGARQASLDPGVMNFCNSGEDGLPGPSRGQFGNSLDDIETTLEVMAKERVGPALGIYEPGYLRPVLAFRRARNLGRGAVARLYFSGEHNFVDGRKGGFGFGLPPTRAALDAYVEMIGDSGLPWMVGVFGGDTVRSGLARYAIERGGHLRIGLEDHAGDRTPTNLELIEEAAALCRELGRPPATCREAAAILDLP